MDGSKFYKYASVIYMNTMQYNLRFLVKQNLVFFCPNKDKHSWKQMYFSVLYVSSGGKLKKNWMVDSFRIVFKGKGSLTYAFNSKTFSLRVRENRKI